MIEEKQDMQQGLKYDSGKLRWDLLPFSEVEDVVRILTFGANKYEENSWQGISNGIERYFAALMRHISAWRNGEEFDEESGETHISHALTNLIFISWLLKDGKKQEESK